jgi:glycosyltransferase involved in cell wall biosynthesis
MNSCPFFHVVIPALNEAKTISNILKDLSMQIYRDFDVTLVDGNSDDDTVPKAQKFSKILPLTIINTKVRNVCFQRNLGAKNTKSPYLVFFDCDNRLPPEFLLGLRYRLSKSPVDAFSTYIRSDESDADHAFAVIANWYMTLLQHTRPVFLESCTGIKTSVFNRVHGFGEKIVFHEGPEMIKRCYPCTFVIFKDPTYQYSMRRMHSDHGSFKTIGTGVMLEITRLLGVSVPNELKEALYPMIGGPTHKVTARRSQKMIDTIKRFLPKSLV